MPAMHLDFIDKANKQHLPFAQAMESHKLLFHENGGDWNVILLEGGMSSGAPSIMVWFVTDKGVIVLETSLDAWRAATVAMSAAAEARWGYTLHD